MMKMRPQPVYLSIYRPEPSSSDKKRQEVIALVCKPLQAFGWCKHHCRSLATRHRHRPLKPKLHKKRLEKRLLASTRDASKVPDRQEVQNWVKVWGDWSKMWGESIRKIANVEFVLQPTRKQDENDPFYEQTMNFLLQDILHQAMNSEEWLMNSPERLCRVLHDYSEQGERRRSHEATKEMHRMEKIGAFGW
jgi:hypothetical protein